MLDLTPVHQPGQLHQQAGASPPQRIKRARLIWVPLLFLAIHWLAINLVATGYLLVLVLGEATWQSLPGLLLDAARLDQLLTAHYPQIAFVYSLLLIPLYLVYLLMRRRKDRRQLLLERPRGRDLFPAMAVTVGLMGLVNIWFWLLTHWRASVPWLDQMMLEYQETADLFSAGDGVLWLTLGIGILTPIAEELLFRGIIQGVFRTVLPEWLAILLQAVLFALFHVQPIQVSYVLLPGLMLGLLYAWTRSIWVPIAMHITFNILGSVVPSLIGGDEHMAQMVALGQMAFILIGTLCLIYLFLTRKKPLAQEHQGV